MCRLKLIAASDDYLLGESLKEAVAAACEAFGGVEPEILAEATTPEALAVQIRSPSLFSPQRVLVLEDIRPWVKAPAPPEAPRATTAPDVAPLERALDDGLPDDVAVVLGAWCGGQPKGPLVDVVKRVGTLSWIPLPPPPKPWEDVDLSQEQLAVLRRILQGVAAGTPFTRDAEKLLLERLGFAPRLLAQEVDKLVTAAGASAGVDEDLVRRLTFPREHSLEVVRDAVLARDPTAIFDLLGAAADGAPVRDWRGHRLDASQLGVVLIGQTASLLEQLLYLRAVVKGEAIAAQMMPERTAAPRWYARVFKPRIAPQLCRLLEEDAPSPVVRGEKMPGTWTLGRLFPAAGLYRDEELVVALAEVGSVEVCLRGALGLGALSGWLGRLFGDR